MTKKAAVSLEICSKMLVFRGVPIPIIIYLYFSRVLLDCNLFEMKITYGLGDCDKFTSNNLPCS